MEGENKRCLLKKIRCSDSLVLVPKEKCGLKLTEEEKAARKARQCARSCKRNKNDDRKKVTLI